jgi:hypothetical protein
MEAMLVHIDGAFAGGERDLLLATAHLVARGGKHRLCMANHVLQELEVRQLMREWQTTPPGPRRSRRPSSPSSRFSARDLDVLLDIQWMLHEILRGGTGSTTVTRGLASLSLNKVEFLLDVRPGRL